MKLNSLYDIPLFVYGTLRHDQENHYRLKNAQYIGPAHAKGFSKTHIDINNIKDSPAIEPDNNIVSGELYLVEPELLKQIDLYELPEYKRIKIQTDNGDAWAYMPTNPLTPQ